MTLATTSQQTPLGSGFGPQSTVRQVLAGKTLVGKTAIVTGGYSGIGLETVRGLVSAGAEVVVPARSLDKARQNLRGLIGVEIAQVDLTDPGSIDAFAESFLASARPLHLLINSAGVMAAPLTRDSRGNEIQFSGNHLGHFHLAARLWPALRAAKGARVVAVSSHGHLLTGVDFDDPNFERRAYDRWMGYGQSKTANILFALGLDQRGRGHDVRAFSLHPGSIATDLLRHLSEDEIETINGASASHRQKTPEQGAATIVWCAVSEQLDGLGGLYCEDCDVAPPLTFASGEPKGLAPWATDPEGADALWRLSEKLTGVSFDA